MAKDDFILAYLLRVDEKSGMPYKGYLSRVENSLEAEQRYVNFGRAGGLIDVLGVDDIDLIFHDEGKLLDFPYNRAVLSEDGIVYDVIVGNIMCVRHNAAGEFISIRESDIETIEKQLKPVLTVVGRNVFLKLSDDLPEYKEDSDGHTDR